MAQTSHRITIRYLAAVAFIYACTAAAWLFLGGVILHRTHHKDHDLRSEVGQIWGSPHHQVPPVVSLTAHKTAVGADDPSGAQARAGDASAPDGTQDEEPPALPVSPECAAASALEPIATVARADLELEHRRKGLLWYSTYGVRFDGTYTVHNSTPCERAAEIWLPFPASGATYDDFSVTVDEEEVAFEVGGSDPEQLRGNGALAAITLPADSSAKVRVRYASRGLDRWSYSFGANTARANNFQLIVRTNFDDVDFPPDTLAPSGKERTDHGWELTWNFKSLLADASIAVDMPHKINPGPLASEISLFAPVSLFFFFFVLLLVMAIKKIPLHPVHFGLVAAAFFSFHLLNAYLVDHVPIWLAFGASSVVSVALVVSYLRLAVGARFALLWAGGAQLVYLILFSLAFFLEGYTGLTITVFSILTLFLVMQLTGRVDWSTVFASKSAPPPSDPQPEGAWPAGPGSAAPGGAPIGVEGEPVFSRVG